MGELVLAFAPAAQDRFGAKNQRGFGKILTINSRSIAK